MPQVMRTVGDIATDAIEYRAVVELIKESGCLDEEMEEKLDGAVTIMEKAQYLGEVASLLEELGLIEEGGAISSVAISGINAARSCAGGGAASILGGSLAGAGTTATLSGSGSVIATCVAGLSPMAAPVMVGALVTGVVGWGISKVWSSIWD